MNRLTHAAHADLRSSKHTRTDKFGTQTNENKANTRAASEGQTYGQTDNIENGSNANEKQLFQHSTGY